MSAPVVAHGISVHASTEGQHVVLCLHDQDGSPMAMILMTPAEAEIVTARITFSSNAVAPAALGLSPSMAVN